MMTPDFNFEHEKFNVVDSEKPSVSRSRQHKNNNNEGDHISPCVPLQVMMANMSIYREFMLEVKAIFKETREEQKKEHDELIARVNSLEDSIQKQKGFVSGAGWMFSAFLAFVVSVVSFAVWVIEKFYPLLTQ